MNEFRIRVDLGHLLPGGSAGDLAFPNLSHAVAALVDRCEDQWKRYASGEPLPSGKTIGVRSGQYLRSIMSRMDGPYSGEVYSRLAYAETIERGAPAWDMRSLLGSSLKVRINKKGGRYLIIPFRHDTGNAMSGGKPMPDEVRRWWQDKSASFVLHVDRRPVHSDLAGNTPKLEHQVHAFRRDDIMEHGPLLTVARRNYWYGDRLTRGDLAAMGRGASSFTGLAGANKKRYEGMLNFRQPGKTGGAAHSQYITFRVLSENSRPGSWMQKAREGYWPARTTADMFRPIAEDIFGKAIEADVMALLPR
jgi:hypothetical protein